VSHFVTLISSFWLYIPTEQISTRRLLVYVLPNLVPLDQRTLISLRMLEPGKQASNVKGPQTPDGSQGRVEGTVSNLGNTVNSVGIP